MKKIISTLLVLVMLLSMVSTFGLTISAAGVLGTLYDSAKDGDLIYTVDFRGDSYYSPFYFDLVQGDGAIESTPSTDGNSVHVEYKAATAARALWGGSIDGLSYGLDKNYTISMKIKIGDYINASGALASSNAGVFINFPNDATKEYLDAYDENGGYRYKGLVGYYGCPTVRHSLSHAAGSKSIGKYLASDNYTTEYLSTPDADGFVDLTFTVEGRTVTVYLNNIYYDEFDALTDEVLATTSDLGFTVYLYNPASGGIENSQAMIDVKNVQIFKGNTVTNPTYPDYYKELPNNIPDYDATAAGAVLYSVDFSTPSALYNPRELSANGSYFTVTTDAGYVGFEAAAADKAFYYGDVIEEFPLAEGKQYTISWRVNTTSQNSGFCFVMPNNEVMNKSINVYGNFSNGSICTCHGGTKITNYKYPAADSAYGSSGYIKADGFFPQIDDYANMLVEIDGYKATIYYFDVFDEWTVYNVIDDVRHTVKYDGTARYDYDNGMSLSVAFYVYNTNMKAEYKDINIYKGTFADYIAANPVEITTEDPGDDTTKAPGDDTTKAPDDTTAAPDDTTANDTTANNTTETPNEGGCASVVGAGVAIVALLGTAIVIKRKH